MLKLILGRKKSGKTEYCLNLIKSLVNDDKNAVVLVPEQFNFECQRLLLNELGPKHSNKVEILSFTGLCDAIQSEIGGFAGVNVDDGTRFILLGQAIASVKDNLKLYAKYYNSSAFIKKMMSAITEFKQANITSDDLNRIALITENENSKFKLQDLSIILSAYNALLKERFIDPLDLIERTLTGMKDNSYFSGKTFIIDEFKGFTAIQFKLLERVIAGSENTYVTLCCDSLIPENETDIFKNIKNTANRLKSLALSHSVEVDEPVYLNNLNSLSSDLQELELFLSDKSVEVFDTNCQNIQVTKADSVFSEIDFCMNTIHRLVRTENYRYRDFVIISRNDTYKDIIDEYANYYELPCFCDRRISALDLPISTFIISAIKAAISFNTEDILKLLKTGLTFVSKQDTVKLENYAYIWSIDGKKWLDNWTMNQNGLTSVDISEEKLHKINEDTEKLDNLRKQVISPLKNFKNNLNGTAEEICRAIFKLFDDYNTVECLKKLTDELQNSGNFSDAEYQINGYDIVIKAFDKIVMSLSDRKINGNEFIEILSAVLGYETVGEIPQTKDQIVYGTADRIRAFRPKCVFVIGVNQDLFPAALNDDGLLTLSERQSMILNDLEISDFGIADCLDEKFLFYSAAASATERLFLTYAKVAKNGSDLEPSIELTAILKHFTELRQLSYTGQLTKELVETKESAFKKLTESYSFDNEDVNSLKEYFSKDDAYSYRIAGIERYINSSEPRISRESASGLYGEELRLSASKVDVFSGCKFKFFAKYGLNAETRERVDFDPLTRGNIVHYCLEKFVKNHLNDIGRLDEDDISNEICTLCDEYISAVVSEREALGEKFNFMLEVIKDTVTGLAIALNNEFAQSDFKPRFCELNVGDNTGVTSIEVKTDRGITVALKGKIDRVDSTDDGKLRVVDYKTGSKANSFKLSEVLNGRDLQMLLYLYSVIKNGNELIKANIPAGVLYFPAHRQADTDDSTFVKMTGLLNDDESILRQMELSLEGKIIPAHIRPNGNSFYSSEALVSEESFRIIFNYLELILQRIGSAIMDGNIEPIPLKVGNNSECKYCDYRSVCRISSQLKPNEGVECKNNEALKLIIKELEDKNGN